MFTASMIIGIMNMYIYIYIMIVKYVRRILRMNKTKIICTLGPASDNKKTLTALMKNGLSVARLNLSHGNQEYLLKLITLIKEVRDELDLPVAILMDTRGPEIRTKTFVDGKIELAAGDEVRLCLGDFEGTKEKFCITYPDLYKDVKPGSSILIDDGLIEVEVKKVVKTDIVCIVKNGGVIKNRKGINVPRVDVKLPAVTKQDEADIIFGIKNGIDFLAASFVRSKKDVTYIRHLLDTNDGEHVQIISKIESQTGVDNIKEIIEVSNGIMIARGDLGVETPPEDIPKIQKKMIMQCNKSAIPVITATQMLESMIINPRPTRAEVSDVANAVFDGTDTLMLSGETAAGAFPVEAVKTMKRIAEATEEVTDYETIYKRIEGTLEKSVTNAVSYATSSTAKHLDAAAIICPTFSGKTARLISMFRPESPIIAPTINKVTQRQLNMLWGVIPIYMKPENSQDLLFYKSMHKSKELGLAKAGDTVVITAGVPLNTKGNTNLMRVMMVD